MTTPDNTPWHDEDVLGLLVELVAEDLKKLVGHRVRPERLGSNTMLGDLAGVPASAPPDVRGGCITRLIKASIRDLHGTYVFRGREYPAAVMAKAFNMLLGFSTIEAEAPLRRDEVIHMLGLTYLTSEQTWRRRGPEREFLSILAQQMVERYAKSQSQTA